MRSSAGVGRRIWRWGRRLLIFVAAPGVTIVALLLLALDLGPTREFVRAQVNRSLSDLFVGQVLIDRVGSLRLDALGGIDGRVLDAQGKRVLTFYGLQVSSRWPQIVRDVVLGRPLEIVLTRVCIDNIEVHLVDGGDGMPNLGSVFNPRHPMPSLPSSPSDLPISFSIDDLRIRKLWAYGNLPALPLIDAEVNGLVGRFSIAARGLSAAISTAQIIARSLPARLDPVGSLSANVEMPANNAADLSGQANFAGELARAQVAVRAEWKGQSLQAHLEAPAVPASVWREHLNGVKLQGDTAIDAHLVGTVPRLDFVAHLKNEAAVLDLSGRMQVERTTRLSCKLSASHLDLGAWLGDLPKTRLSTNASASVALQPEGVLNGEYEVSTLEGTVGDFETPRWTTKGTLARDAQGMLAIDGHLAVEEPGAAVRAQYRLRVPNNGDPLLNSDIKALISEPPRLVRMVGVKVTGMVTATAKLNTATNYLDARGSAHFSRVSSADVQVADLDVVASTKGKATSPYWKVSVDAHRVTAFERLLKQAQVMAIGTLDQFQVSAALLSDGRVVRVGSRISTARGISMDGTRLVLSDREGEVTVGARQIRYSNGTASVDDLELSGVGEGRASGSFGGRRFEAKFDVNALDLGRLSRLVNTRWLDAGILSFDGSVAGTLDRFEGRMQGHARDLVRGHLEGGVVDFEFEATEKRVNGSLEGQIGDSRIRARLSDLDPPDGSFSLAQLRELKGELAVDANLDLRHFTFLLRHAGVPIERMDGKLALEFRALNPRATSATPRMAIRLETSGLRVIEQRKDVGAVDSPSQAQKTQPRVLEGIDGALDLVVDPQTEQALLKLNLFDQIGRLVVLEAETKVPALATSDWRGQIEQTPMHVSVRLPNRALQKLPGVLRPSLMRGLVGGEIVADGTIHEPRLRAHFAVMRLQSRDGKRSVDVGIDTYCDSTGGTIEGHARSTRGGTADLHTSWKGNLIEQIRSGGAEAANFFELSTDVTLDSFPLALVPALSDRQVRGPLSGKARLRGLGSDAKLEAEFDGSGVSVNRVRLPQLKAVVRVNDAELFATADVVQEAGKAHAEVRAKSKWGRRWLPEFEPTAKLRLTAQAFQLEALSPFVMQYLSALQGELDADISVRLDPEKPELEGRAALTNGVIQVPQVGQRFTDVRANLSIHSDEIRVDSIQARGLVGRLTGEARAKLKGTQVESISAKVDIREKEKLPITFEGVEIGEAWGHADLSYADTNGLTEVNVEVPQFHLDMPEAAQQSIQDLSPAADIRIGSRRTDRKFVKIPLQPMREAASEAEDKSVTRMRVRLGDSVWISRGRQVKAQVAGELRIESGKEQKVGGRIEVRGGKLDVSGKQFEIERGLITFSGTETSNPTITATARWDSPAGYVVYADYVGTVENGKLTLRSEPVLAQDEVLSLLIFGAPEGNTATSGNSGTSGGIGSSGRATGSTATSAERSGGSSGSVAAGAAVSIAGGTATKGLNRALSDVTSLDVSTRIDTSTGSARPELVVQLTPRLTTRVTRALGEPAPGQSPDRTFLTLELRLLQRWSASAVVGDRGASILNLIWRKRY